MQPLFPKLVPFPNCLYIHCQRNAHARCHISCLCLLLGSWPLCVPRPSNVFVKHPNYICQFPMRHLWEGASSHLKSVCKPLSKHLSMLLRLLAYCLCCSGVVVGPPPKPTFPQSFPQNGTMARREMGESCVYIFEAVLQVTSLRFVVPFSRPTQAAHNRDTCTRHMWTYTTATHTVKHKTPTWKQIWGMNAVVRERALVW